MNFLVAIENENIKQYLTKIIRNRNDSLLAFPNDPALFYCIIDKYKPDWIIIDLNLKKINAFDLAEKIKMKFPGFNICMLSDVADERLIKKGKLIGADAFISKENLFDFYNIIYSVPTK